MRNEMSDDEIDHVMANIYPGCRRWCDASCGLRPDIDYSDVPEWACACMGCIGGALSWDDFSAWQLREAQRDPTPYIGHPAPPPPPTLTERLEKYKAAKRSREMIWGDIVPLGYYPTWACEPNSTLEDVKAMAALFGL